MSKEREKFIKALGIKSDGQKAKVIRELSGPFWRELKATVNPKKDRIVRISATSTVVHYDVASNPFFFFEGSRKFTGS